MRSIKLLSLCCVGILSAATTLAHADTFFYLTQGSSGVGPNLAIPGYGTITLHQNGSGTSSTVTVTEVLTNAGAATSSGEAFADTGAGNSLAFTLDTSLYSIGGISSGFFHSGAGSSSPFGSFGDSVDCISNGEGSPVSCQGGDALHPNTSGPLSFTVSGSAGNGIFIADFIGNSTHSFFASDIFLGNAITGAGNTGNVAAGDGTTPVNPITPEPSSLILLGTGIVGAAGFLRRRR